MNEMKATSLSLLQGNILIFPEVPEKWVTCIYETRAAKCTLLFDLRMLSLLALPWLPVLALIPAHMGKSQDLDSKRLRTPAHIPAARILVVHAPALCTRACMFTCVVHIQAGADRLTGGSPSSPEQLRSDDSCVKFSHSICVHKRVVGVFLKVCCPVLG